MAFGDDHLLRVRLERRWTMYSSRGVGEFCRPCWGTCVTFCMVCVCSSWAPCKPSDNGYAANIGLAQLVFHRCQCSFPFRPIYCRNQCAIREEDRASGCTTATEGFCTEIGSPEFSFCFNEQSILNDDRVSELWPFLTI